MFRYAAMAISVFAPDACGLHMLSLGLGPCDGFGMVGGGETGSVDAELHAYGFGGGERGLGAIPDHLSFVLGEGGPGIR